MRAEGCPKGRLSLRRKEIRSSTGPVAHHCMLMIWSMFELIHGMREVRSALGKRAMTAIRVDLDREDERAVSKPQDGLGESTHFLVIVIRSWKRRERHLDDQGSSQ